MFCNNGTLSAQLPQLDAHRTLVLPYSTQPNTPTLKTSHYTLSACKFSFFNPSQHSLRHLPRLNHSLTCPQANLPSFQLAESSVLSQALLNNTGSMAGAFCKLDLLWPLSRDSAHRPSPPLIIIHTHAQFILAQKQLIYAVDLHTCIDRKQKIKINYTSRTVWCSLTWYFRQWFVVD